MFLVFAAIMLIRLLKFRRGLLEPGQGLLDLRIIYFNIYKKLIRHWTFSRKKTCAKAKMGKVGNSLFDKR